MVEELFRQDAYLKEADGTVTLVTGTQHIGQGHIVRLATRIRARRKHHRLHASCAG